jgi:glutathione S-transferase
MNKIQFYSFALSPYALKVHCYLLYLDIDFETVFVDPLKMRKILPVGATVPVLSINGESRNESSDLGFWLGEMYPEKGLVPKKLEQKIVKADQWVGNRLINYSFRESIGFDDPLVTRARKRLHLSKALGQTSPNGVSSIFRLLHMVFLGQTFIKRHIAMTDKTRPLSELKVELAEEFEVFLEGGPFLCGSQQPTMADLSAYPHVVRTKIVDGGDYFLPGEVVHKWVLARRVRIVVVCTGFSNVRRRADESTE